MRGTWVVGYPLDQRQAHPFSTATSKIAEPLGVVYLQPISSGFDVAPAEPVMVNLINNRELSR